MAEQELEYHCIVADSDAFIDQYFPVSPKVVNKVWTKVRETHYDTKRKTWSSVPEKSAKESYFYTPFIDVCEAIRRAYDEDEDNKHYSCRWFTKAPKSPDMISSLIRPDLFLLLGMEDEAREWEEKLEKLKEKSKQEQLIKYVIAWWLRVGTIIEVKPHDDGDVLLCVTQLMTYLRQVLREQLDRWFVPGFLLTGTQFTAWVVDRSGAIGMQKSFDFHRQPKKFVQIILACSMLPPSKLGWDISMKLWKRPEPLHSFNEKINIKDYAENASARQWVIEMPAQNKHNKPGGKRELFLTTKALSVATAECMQGRATVVWAAQRLEGGQVVSDEIFILKQCWRPTTAKPEGELYPPAEEAEEHHIGRVYSYEDVKVDGSTINTHEFIRDGLEHKALHSELKTRQKRKRGMTKFKNAEVFIVPNTDCLIFNFKEVRITDRTLSRILLYKSHGWALHRFSDRLELVSVCSDIIEALEFLYYQKKTLQRDLSIGNVLISSIDGKGCLIDFDYAKVIEKTKPTFLEEMRGFVLDKHGEKCRKILQFTREHLSPRAAHALAFYKVAHAYLHELETVIKVSPSNQTDLSEGDLGFLTGENIRIPDLTNHEPQSIERSATLPFASSEVLSPTDRIFPLPFPSVKALQSDWEINSSNVPHDVRHDIEALFWCITYICLTREGPGGERREELRPEFKATEENQDIINLRRIHYYFFSSEEATTLIRSKAKLFRLNNYNREIIPHFHPYFEPLKPLMRQWWNILWLAHQYPMFETIHQALRKVLASTCDELRNYVSSSQDLQKTAKVIEDRKHRLEKLRQPTSTNMEGSASAPLDASPRIDRTLRSHGHTGSDDIVVPSGSSPSPSSSLSPPKKRKKTTSRPQKKRKTAK